MLLRVLIFILLALAAPPLAAQTPPADFSGGVPGGPCPGFSAFVGTWHIDRDGDNLVCAVDGRKWEQGLMAEGIASKAKALYGRRYAEFLDNLEAYRYFPLTIREGGEAIERGVLRVRFKTMSGRIDQAAGIAFAIQPNGDYLVVRANPLEQNLVLFKMDKGRRSSVQWIRDVPQHSRRWHTLEVILDGASIRGLLDGKPYIDYTGDRPASGKVGLWSKADSYVFFDDFVILPR